MLLSNLILALITTMPFGDTVEPVTIEEPIIPLDEFIQRPPVDWEEPPYPPMHNFEATFYTAFCDTGCIGITRTGYDVSDTIYAPSGRRVIAVDPTIIPLHSIVEVELEDGRVFEAEALDTGGAIQGEIIDVLVKTTVDAYAKGRQHDVTVTVLERGDK